MHFTLHEAVALETTQSLRKHFLRNPTDRALQFCITHRAPRKDLNHKRRPFVGNPLEHKS